MWLTIPFGGGSGQSTTLIDIVVYANSKPDTLRLSVTTAFVGEETVQYNEPDLNVLVGTITLSGTVPASLGGQGPFQTVSTLRFAPSLGYLFSRRDRSIKESLNNEERRFRFLDSHRIQ